MSDKLDREALAEGREHLTGTGTFQSDKYPTVPAGKVPLSVKDPMAQDLLRIYADRRESVDAEFTRDLHEALDNVGAKGLDALDAKDALIERLVSLISIATLNAELVPDPRMNGLTDCYALPLEDIDGLRAAQEEGEGHG